MTNRQQRKIERIGRRYQRELLRLERQYYRDIRQEYRQWVRDTINGVSAFGVNVRLDGPFDAIGSFFERRKDAWGKVVARFAFRITQTANSIADLSRTAFSEQVEVALDVSPFFAEPWLETELDAYTKENVALITKIGNDTADRIQTLVTDAVKNGASTSKLTDEIKLVMKTSDNRAKLIARDQVGKFQGRLTQVRMEQAGVSQYIWQTSEDSRVRKKHQALNGDKRTYGKGIEPGQEIACRCIALIDPGIYENHPHKHL